MLERGEGGRWLFARIRRYSDLGPPTCAIVDHRATDTQYLSYRRSVQSSRMRPRRAENGFRGATERNTKCPVSDEAVTPRMEETQTLSSYSRLLSGRMYMRKRIYPKKIHTYVLTIFENSCKYRAVGSARPVFKSCQNYRIPRQRVVFVLCIFSSEYFNSSNWSANVIFTKYCQYKIRVVEIRRAFGLWCISFHRYISKHIFP